MNKTEWSLVQVKRRIAKVSVVIMMLKIAQDACPKNSQAHLSFEPLLLARREEREWLYMLLVGWNNEDPS